MEGEDDRRSPSGLQSNNVVRARGEEVAGDDGRWNLGPWLVAIRQWLPGPQVLGEKGKMGSTGLEKQPNIANLGEVDLGLGSNN